MGSSSSLGGQAFQGNQVVGVQTTTGFYEEALHGFDAEVGYLIPGLAWETRAFAGGYYFDGDIVDSMTGVRVRAETRPMKNIALSLAYQNDDLFDDQATLELRYSFGYKAEKGHRTLEERMIQFPGRDIDIIETSGLSPRDVTKTSSTQVALANDVVHIDNTAGAGGDGSFEDPFDSIGACEASGECAGDPADYVFLHAGDSRSGTPYDPIDGIELAPGQSLIGEGVDFMGIAAGDHPVIEWDFAANGPGDIITLADDNTVAGLELRGAARDRVLHPDQIANPGAYIYVEGNAIAGYNVTGFNIHDNIISNPSTFPVPYGTAGGAVPGTSPAYNPSGHGIYITHVTGSTLDGNGSITGNTIVGTFLEGIHLHAYSSTVGTFNQTVTLSNNLVQSSGEGVIPLLPASGFYHGGNGVSIFSAQYSGSTLNQDLTITGNTVNDSLDDGIAVVAYNSINAEVNQTITLTDNMLTTNGGDGFEVDIEVYDGPFTQVITAQNNTMTNNDVWNLHIDASARDNGGDSSQTITLMDNLIANNAADGVYIDADVTEFSCFNRAITLTSNNISINAGDGVSIHEELVTGSGATNETITFTDNTIRTNAGDGVAIYLEDGSESIGDLTQTVMIHRQ